MSATVFGAISLAGRAHGAQVDRGGESYLGHLARVARVARGIIVLALAGDEAEADHAEQVGWLHDVVEDTGVTFDALVEAGFAPAVCNAVGALTRRPGETYAARISAIAARGGRIALAVKLADLDDNLDPARPSTADLPTSLRTRYLAAREVLQAAAATLRPVPPLHPTIKLSPGA